MLSQGDDEFIWLQIRRIVELVAYSAIAADEQRYAALRREQDKNADYRNDGKPAKVLKHLSQISPHFLPRSLGDMVEQADGTRHFRSGSDVAVLERFLDIHETAGRYLHAVNPFNEEDAKDRELALAGARGRAQDELAYLKGVLWNHAKIGLRFEPGGVPRRLDDAEQAWIMSFGAPETDNIQMMLAKGI